VALLLTVRIAVPDVVILVGLMLAVRPGDGVTVRDTMPVKPLRGVTVIVEVPEEPTPSVRLDGLAEIAKSGDVVPVTVTVTPVW
jgi:hypothetical protein